MIDNQGHIEVAVEDLQYITTEQAWHYRIIPKQIELEIATFYIDSNQDITSCTDELEMLLGKTVQLEPLEKDVIQQTLSRLYRNNSKKKTNSVLSYSNEDFVLELIVEADELDCSDIHIETYEDKCRVRLRIDGKLIEKYIINKEEYPAIINKLKIRANLDIAEKRLPQDGRISFAENGKNFDIRVSVLPTLHGEKIVLRLSLIHI